MNGGGKAVGHKDARGDPFLQFNCCQDVHVVSDVVGRLKKMKCRSSSSNSGCSCSCRYCCGCFGCCS